MQSGSARTERAAGHTSIAPARGAPLMASNVFKSRPLMVTILPKRLQMAKDTAWRDD